MEKIKKNYVPGSMSFAEGFLGPKGNVGFIMKMDRTKAKSIIEQLIKDKRKIVDAKIGLDGDWTENSDVFFDGKKFCDTEWVYSESQWAKSILIVTFEDSPSETYEVWKK